MSILQCNMDAFTNLRSGHGKAALPLPEHVALLLQGGGALGSFQAGAYEQLVHHGIDIDWVAGISIGAINAAIIAGNEPHERIDKLNLFWEKISSCLPDISFFFDNHDFRELMHLGAATAVSLFGVPGFFSPQYLPPILAPKGSPSATSLYDTTPLVQTLNELVNWDLLNDGPVRFSVGTVDIESGNFIYFDTGADLPDRIDHRHIMASGALPPGLPAVEIDGRHYWDGGLVSNTPLAHVLDHQNSDMLIFQIDLFPAEGPLPLEITDSLSRAKDIQYSSRTRQVTDLYLERMRMKKAVRKVLDKLPDAMADDPDVIRLSEITGENVTNIVHLIYRRQTWESSARDFEFSRATMRDHWHQGVQSVVDVMHEGDLIARNIASGKSATFDLQPAHEMKEKSI